MKKLIIRGWQQVLDSKLLSGSVVLLIGSIIANFGNYLYHLILGRMLGPANYGVFESLISLLYILGIPMGALSTLIVKYVSQFKGEKRLGAIGKFFQKLNSDFLWYASAGLIIFLISSPFIKQFFHLDSLFPIVGIGAMCFLGFFVGINRSFLQGLAKFVPLSVFGILEVIVKLGLTFALVFVGLGVNGAILAMLATAIFSYLITKFYFKGFAFKVSLGEKLGRQDMQKFLLPSLLLGLSFTSLYTSDVMLARHFLPGTEAGYYAAIATLCKIIFFISSPITAVLFPLVSESHAAGEKHDNYLKQSLGLVGLSSLGMFLLYYLFPGIMVNLLYGSSYMPAAKWLAPFALVLGLYSISSLLASYFFSIKQTRVVVFPILSAVVQVVLILFFHENISQFILSSLSAVGILLAGLVLYYLRYERK